MFLMSSLILLMYVSSAGSSPRGGVYPITLIFPCCFWYKCKVLGLVFFSNYNDYVKLDSLIMLRVNVTCLFVRAVLLVTPLPGNVRHCHRVM